MKNPTDGADGGTDETGTAALMLMMAGVFVMWFLFFRINTVEQVFEESVWESQGNRNALILYQKSRFSLSILFTDSFSLIRHFKIQTGCMLIYHRFLYGKRCLCSAL